MKKLLLAPKCQYGYQTDYLQMANRLSEKNVHVEIVCFDQSLPKVKAPQNVNVTYVKRTENKLGNYIRHLLAIGKYTIRNRKDLNWVLISGTIELCCILPLFLKTFTQKVQWIMDVRTCTVDFSARKRTAYDRLMLFSSFFFEKITIISPLVAERLKIKQYEVLPLGSDCYVNLESKKLDVNNLKFLYVGGISGRNIETIIQAFDIFTNNLNESFKGILDIVGYSDDEETTQKILKAIKNSKAPKNIIFHGRKTHQEILGLFQEATIGFSYVPITDFYDVQPPTKTYEYIMNGIICLGTNTRANQEIINERNGLLTEDDVNSVVAGIEKVIKNINNYNSAEIAETVKDSKWETIISNFYDFLQHEDLKRRPLLKNSEQKSA